MRLTSATTPVARVGTSLRRTSSPSMRPSPRRKGMNLWTCYKIDFMDSDIVFPASDETHVWQARLDDPHTELSRLHETLSADERERAARFYFEKHRRRFIVARSILRAMIARYLGTAAKDIRFTYSAKGKPVLAVPRVENFAFNVSHSEDLALFAFVAGAVIGINVEIIRPLNDMDSIAQRFF